MAKGVGGISGAGCCMPMPMPNVFNGNGFLLLLLLFILLAAGPAWGIDNKYFFVIILAVIGFGGFGRTFGFGAV